MSPQPLTSLRLTLGIVGIAALAACATAPVGSPSTQASSAPATLTPTPPVSVATHGRPTAAVTAHPLATQAAMRILAEGGSAMDATIAAQMVIGLVESQSSGIGGGVLMMVWDASQKRLRSYDGLAAAPARTTSSLRTDVDGKLLPAQDVARGGRSVGVPGALMALELGHRQHGKLPWARLFEPAIQLATDGFPLAPYARGILARDPGAVEHPEFRHDHFDSQGQALPAGTTLRNPAYAETLRKIATVGVDRFWREGGAARLVAAAQRGIRPTLMTEQDILSYRAVEREPVCAPSRSFKVCTMAPPSFGGVTVLQMLTMLAQHSAQPTLQSLSDPGFWHLYAEAGRLAQADRRQYIGDPDHLPVPVAGMTAAPYLQQRAALLNPEKAAASVRHGTPAGAAVSHAPGTEDPAHSADQTSQMVIVDAQGQIVSTTTTINLNFGSRLRVDGYVLNNALTNFGPAPEAGRTQANQMAPGKRPVTSMSPLVVFDAAGQPVVAGGSAGGGQIVDYIARSLIEMLWLNRTPAEALADGHVTTALAPRIQLEANTPKATLAPALKALGHDVVVEPTVSGAGFIKRAPGGWVGAADPRRDGVALGR